MENIAFFVKRENSFKDIADKNFKRPKIRTVISADFDNDGYDEIFLNNIGSLINYLRLGKMENFDITSLKQTVLELVLLWQTLIKMEF